MPVSTECTNQCYSSDERQYSLPGSSPHLRERAVSSDKMGERQKSPSVKKMKTSVNNKVAKKRALFHECLAECLGTFILMVFGNGSVAQSTLSRGESGNFLTIYWSYGLGVTMAVYVAGGVSGGHINPAVSLAQTVIGRLPLIKLPFYVLSQTLGAFLSGPVVYGIYYDALNSFDGGVRQVLGENGTAGIFATYPQPHLSILNGFFDQVFATSLLLIGILAINDDKNMKPPKGLEPLMVGFLVFIIGGAYGYNCGYAINPARDFGPRLFTFFAGWGTEVFTAGNYWWWVPIVAPLVGGVTGAVVYLLVIEFPRDKEPTSSTEEDSNDSRPNIIVYEAENEDVTLVQQF